MRSHLPLLFVLAAPGGAAEPVASAPRYALDYEVRLVPTERAARVRIRLGEGAAAVHEIRFRIDPERHRQFSGDGEVTSLEDAVEWRPPEQGGSLRYVFRIDHLRDERSYDARCAQDWALLRGDDLVPPARVRSAVGAHSRARLRLRLPEGWSAALPYERGDDGRYLVDHAERRFDRPVGWMVLGELGVARERVAGARVAIAGPRRQGLRRQDLLAFLRWTLPSLRDVFGSLPERLLIVGAGDPMWRGGLSGPRSLYLHAERPLITEDGTSPVLHELFHTVLGRSTGPGDDWISEGLAEYYALAALVRSRTVGRSRHERVLARLKERGSEAPRLRVERADGAVTARAVGVFADLDAELRKRTAEKRSLDDVVRELAGHPGTLTTERLRQVAEQVAGGSLAAFFRRRGLGA